MRCAAWYLCDNPGRAALPIAARNPPRIQNLNNRTPHPGLSSLRSTCSLEAHPASVKPTRQTYPKICTEIHFSEQLNANHSQHLHANPKFGIPLLLIPLFTVCWNSICESAESARVIQDLDNERTSSIQIHQADISRPKTR